MVVVPVLFDAASDGGSTTICSGGGKVPRAGRTDREDADSLNVGCWWVFWGGGVGGGIIKGGGGPAGGVNGCCIRY